MRRCHTREIERRTESVSYNCQRACFCVDNHAHTFTHTPTPTYKQGPVIFFKQKGIDVRNEENKTRVCVSSQRVKNLRVRLIPCVRGVDVVAQHKTKT